MQKNESQNDVIVPNKATQMWILMWALLLDVLGIWMFIPWLEALSNMYSATNTIWLFGKSPAETVNMILILWATIYSLSSFFTTPLLWQLSDNVGRKKPLLACIVSTWISYLILLYSHSIWGFVLARIINWLVGWNISILTSMMSDMSKTPAERTKNFWTVWMMFSLGFIIWPLFWTLIIKNFWVNAIFLFWAIFSFLEALLIAFVLKETHPHSSHKKIQFNVFSTFRKYLSISPLNNLFFSIILTWIASFAFQSVMAFYFPKYFGIPGHDIGNYMAVMGFASAVNQWFLLPKVWLKYFEQKTIMKVATLALPIIFLIIALFPYSFWVFAVLIIVNMILNWTANPVYQSEIIKHTSKEHIWEVNGLISSLWSLWMIFGPMLGTYMHINLQLPVTYASAILALIATYFVLNYLNKIKNHDNEIMA